jgi:anti-anti-sigma factor
MSRTARISVAETQPEGAVVAEISPADRRLITGLETGPNADSTLLGDDLWHVADQSPGPIVLDMRGVDWIDSGACAVLIRFWKDLRAKGRPLVLCVTESVRETFRITGLVRLIPCYVDLDETIQAARTAEPAVEAGKQVG